MKTNKVTETVSPIWQYGHLNIFDSDLGVLEMVVTGLLLDLRFPIEKRIVEEVVGPD